MFRSRVQCDRGTWVKRAGFAARAEEIKLIVSSAPWAGHLCSIMFSGYVSTAVALARNEIGITYES